MTTYRIRRLEMPGNCFRAILGAAVMTAVMAAGSATACSFHVTNLGGIQSAYPGSLATAVAVGQAKASGQLPSVELRSDVLGYWQVTRLLERLRAELTVVEKAGAPKFSMLLVEQKLWTDFEPRWPGETQAYAAAVHAATPGPEATVVVTAFPVLHALLEGGMSPEEALNANLMIVVGEDREAVLEVLSHSVLLSQFAVN